MHLWELAQPELPAGTTVTLSHLSKMNDELYPSLFVRPDLVLRHITRGLDYDPAPVPVAPLPQDPMLIGWTWTRDDTATNGIHNGMFSIAGIRPGDAAPTIWTAPVDDHDEERIREILLIAAENASIMWAPQTGSGNDITDKVGRLFADHAQHLLRKQLSTPPNPGWHATWPYTALRLGLADLLTKLVELCKTEGWPADWLHESWYMHINDGDVPER